LCSAGLKEFLWHLYYTQITRREETELGILENKEKAQTKRNTEIGSRKWNCWLILYWKKLKTGFAPIIYTVSELLNSWCMYRAFCVIYYLDKNTQYINNKICIVKYFMVQILFLINHAFVGLDQICRYTCTRYKGLWE
jgi:hypothetical protein